MDIHIKQTLSKRTDKKPRNILVLQFIIFLGMILLSIVGYLVFLRFYMQLVADPIIFFASLLCAVLLPLLFFLVIRLKFKKIYDMFTSIILCLFCAVVIVGFSVFGPVFIDRSISYHIAFYAAEEGSVPIDSIKESFSNAIFEKRIHDAEVSGFIQVKPDGSFVPTAKAKFMTSVLMPIGEFTHSLGTYDSMKNEVKQYGEKAPSQKK